MARHENTTFLLPPVDVVWSDLIRYDGTEYTENMRGDLFYRGPSGKYIIGNEVLRMLRILAVVKFRKVFQRRFKQVFVN